MESNVMTKEEMREIVGAKKVIKISGVKRDSLGTYYEVYYDDGSSETVAIAWYA